MTPEQQNKMVELYHQGLPKTKIAQILNCSTATILRNLRKLDQEQITDPMIGQTFNRLTVISRAPKRDNLTNRCIYYICKCSCGKTIEVNGSALRSGHTQSCGCLRAENVPYQDLTGQRFGKLLVQSLAGSEGRRKIWHCLCDCGNEIDVNSHALLGGETKSCGCLKSWPEQLIKDWLDDHNIRYKREYSFNDLRGKRNPLRFDFAILKNDQIYCLLEYQGEQHFDIKNTWHTESLVNSDAAKKEYCKTHNIKLYELTKLNWKQILERIDAEYGN